MVKDTWFYRLVRPLVYLFMKITFRPTIVGLDNIPKIGGVVLAGNHTKWLDPLLLVAVSRRQVHFLAKDELFHGITKGIVKGMGAIPVNRKIHDKGALQKGYDTLSGGNVVGIFPESTINRTDDVIMPFKIGAVKMASTTQSYVVPFTITGKYKAFRKSVRIEFYKPYKISDDLDRENEKLMQIISSNLIKHKGENYHERREDVCL